MPQQKHQVLKKLDLPAVDASKLQGMISRWKNTEGSGAELADLAFSSSSVWDNQPQVLSK